MRGSALPDVAGARALIENFRTASGATGPRKVNKPLALYGAGSLGRMAKEFFAMLGIPFRYVVDSNPGRYAGAADWTGIDVIGLRDVPVSDRRDCLFAVCVATVPFASIAAPLSRLGFRDVVPFYDITEAYRDVHPMGNGWFTGELTADDAEGIDYVTSELGGRASPGAPPAVHRLAQRAAGARFSGRARKLDDRYFIPEVRSLLGDKEIFLDGGAHHGEVSLRFMEICRPAVREDLRGGAR